MFRRLCSLILFVSVTAVSVAQISIGGDPLPTDKMLRSVANDGIVEMSSFDKNKLLKEDSLPQNRYRSIRFANKFKTDIRPENSGVRFTLADGTHVWQVKIRSKDAYSINLHFGIFRIPDGAKLFIYNTQRTHKIGAFTSLNNNSYNELPTAPVYGDEIVVEYQEPANASFRGSLAIDEVNHDYRGLTLRARPGQLFSSQTCHLNASCFPEFDEISRAVTLLIVNGTEFCTGCMVNNTNEDGSPYLLSAAHCFAPKSGATSQTRAKNTIIFFNYRNPSCRTSIIGSEEMSMAGTDLLLWEQSLDIALVKLKNIPPVWYRPVYAGWNINTPNSSKYRAIHHPMSKVQKLATTESALQLTSYTGSDGTFTMESNVHWRVARWLDGTTEGGSSGSPLFDINKRLIGTLTGGSSYCDSPTDDYYAALSKNFAFYSSPTRQLRNWLDPQNKGIKEINSFNPYPDNSCTRVSNIDRLDSVGTTFISLPATGPLFGHNSTLSSEFAEKFSNGKNGILYGVYLVFPKWYSALNGKIDLKIYSGETKPDKLLYTQTVQLSYLSYSGGTFTNISKPDTRNSETFILLSKPLNVEKNFFVSYSIKYPSSDTLSVLNVINRSSNFNTAYLYTGTQWQTPYEAGISSLNTSLWIDPVINLTDTSNTNNNTASSLKLYYSSLNRSLRLKGLKSTETGDLSIYNSSGKLMYSNQIYADGVIELPVFGKGFFIAVLRTPGQTSSCRFILY